MEFSVTAVFLMGLLGGAHCAAMCGGIVGAFSLRPAGMAAHHGYDLPYNGGRIGSYVLAGALAGWAGAGGLLLEELLPMRALLYALAKGQSARERAIDVFSQLRIWDTEHNNGVLIYLLLADRDVEIVADRGIHAKVGLEEWEKVCHTMETAFKRARYEQGVVSGIQAVTQHLARHFPAAGSGRNELPDHPVVL